MSIKPPRKQVAQIGSPFSFKSIFGAAFYRKMFRHVVIQDGWVLCYQNHKLILEGNHLQVASWFMDGHPICNILARVEHAPGIELTQPLAVSALAV